MAKSKEAKLAFALISSVSLLTGFSTADPTIFTESVDTLRTEESKDGVTAWDQDTADELGVLNSSDFSFDSKVSADPLNAYHSYSAYNNLKFVDDGAVKVEEGEKPHVQDSLYSVPSGAKEGQAERLEEDQDFDGSIHTYYPTLGSLLYRSESQVGQPAKATKANRK